MKKIAFTAALLLIAGACGTADLTGDLKQFAIKVVIAAGLIAYTLSGKKKEPTLEEKIWRDIAV